MHACKVASGWLCEDSHRGMCTDSGAAATGKGMPFMAAARRGHVSARQGTVQESGAHGPPGRPGADKPALREATSSSSGATTASEGETAPQGAPDRSTVKMVERAIFLHHPYENRERLRSILPRETSAQALDCVLDHLERSGRIAIDGASIRWAAGADGALKADDKSILAGTRFEWLEEDKLQTETIGEYIARIYNADEPGSYTAEDAGEFDEGMRRMARGDCYTHEQVWKELGA